MPKWGRRTKKRTRAENESNNSKERERRTRAETESVEREQKPRGENESKEREQFPTCTAILDRDEKTRAMPRTEHLLFFLKHIPGGSGLYPFTFMARSSARYAPPAWAPASVAPPAMRSQSAPPATGRKEATTQTDNKMGRLRHVPGNLGLTEAQLERLAPTQQRHQDYITTLQQDVANLKTQLAYLEQQQQMHASMTQMHSMQIQHVQQLLCQLTQRMQH